ncbi:predicted protein [Plenodomus lingam JN3]|uniref:Predicted protein n=1 Tax=Leptosphaeria maculans (strain JN3 / isolate v23.1.3 / race Av1-4-5-6-7-8) TaxID=985895 RepID=E5AFK0_LEPMJ|nr:predicted protein [Plenodomus lingam JN3]CBY01989.1 predicted protein [Plenodomus lingam JN3]
MKPTTTTTTATTLLLLATLTLANPAAPAPQPNPQIAPPLDIAARDAAILESIQLEARAKKPKPGSSEGGNGNSSNSTGAAVMMTTSRALQVGALGLGVVEVLHLKTAISEFHSLPLPLAFQSL